MKLIFKIYIGMYSIIIALHVILLLFIFCCMCECVRVFVNCIIIKTFIQL